MFRKRLGLIFGTRPEAVKMAPLVWPLLDDPRFEPVVISTGQHREMLNQTLEEFRVRPDLDLQVMVAGQTLTGVTHRILSRLEESGILRGLDAVLVHGDTASTLAGALAGLHAHVPVIHVEAGLRSGELTSPFPEEANRRLVAQIASLHLAPTPSNAANLIREGVTESSIVVTGNTIVDALHWGTKVAGDYGDPHLADLDTDPRSVVVATAHRRESHGLAMVEIGHGLRKLAERPDVRIVVPLHLNPAVRDVLGPLIADVKNITVVDPLPYLAFCRLLTRADILLSDSSGAEEEGPTLGIPTLVLRERSERRESLLTGGARLVGRDRHSIAEAAGRLLDDRGMYERMSRAMSPYGDGRAVERSIAAIANYFGLGPACAPFVPGAELEPAWTLRAAV